MCTKFIHETISSALNPKAQQTWDPAVQPCLSFPSLPWLCRGPFLVVWCTSLSPNLALNQLLWTCFSCVIICPNQPHSHLPFSFSSILEGKQNPLLLLWSYLILLHGILLSISICHISLVKSKLIACLSLTFIHIYCCHYHSSFP